MTLQDALYTVIAGRSLTRHEAADAMRCLMSGEATPALMGAFLTALRMKGETVEEITGLAETMRALATQVPTNRSPLVDTCGTGGDHSGTFNISTTAAFVVAGAGVAVAKHGNRSATSQCGSADVLESLGVNIDLSPDRVGKCVDEVGIGFLFARALHGAMKHVAPVRSEIKIRTVFNLLGPMTNPANADGQIMGVFDVNLVESVAAVLQGLGVRHAFVVASRDGLDELSISGPSIVAESLKGAISTYEVSPEQFGLKTAPKTAILGGEAVENAAILRGILKGDSGPCRDIVLLNAAPAIVAGKCAETIADGVAVARESIDSGMALKKLEQLIAFTRG